MVKSCANCSLISDKSWFAAKVKQKTNPAKICVVDLTYERDQIPRCIKTKIGRYSLDTENYNRLQMSINYVVLSVCGEYDSQQETGRVVRIHNRILLKPGLSSLKGLVM